MRASSLPLVRAGGRWTVAVGRARVDVADGAMGKLEAAEVARRLVAAGLVRVFDRGGQNPAAAATLHHGGANPAPAADSLHRGAKAGILPTVERIPCGPCGDCLSCEIAAMRRGRRGAH